MAFYYEPERGPVVRQDLAHQANKLAMAWADAQRSWDALRQRSDEELKNPAYQRIREAPQGPRFLLWSAVTLIVFPTIVIWEGGISGEGYEVQFPLIWWVPMVFCMGLGIWASAIFAESTSEFAVLSHISDRSEERERAIASAMMDLYDVPQERRAPGWILHPATGVLITISLMLLIYWFSWKRVELLKEQAGKDIDLVQLYLPVGLYVAEIFAGMPAFFVAACHYMRWRIRNIEIDLAKSKRARDMLSREAVEQYTQYLEVYHRYNALADQQQQPRALLIPASVELRQILKQEWGDDPTQSSSEPGASNGGPTSSTSVNGDSVPGPAESSPAEEEQVAEPTAASSRDSMNGTGGPATTAGGTSSITEEVHPVEAPVPPVVPPPTPPTNSPREDDLLKLLDEVIVTQNNRF